MFWAQAPPLLFWQPLDSPYFLYVLSASAAVKHSVLYWTAKTEKPCFLAKLWQSSIGLSELNLIPPDIALLLVSAQHPRLFGLHSSSSSTDSSSRADLSADIWDYTFNTMKYIIYILRSLNLKGDSNVLRFNCCFQSGHALFGFLNQILLLLNLAPVSNFHGCYCWNFIAELGKLSL